MAVVPRTEPLRLTRNLQAFPPTIMVEGPNAHEQGSGYIVVL